MGFLGEWSGRENGNNCLPFAQMMNNKMRVGCDCRDEVSLNPEVDVYSLSGYHSAGQ
jgi:hypothetical protein